MTFHDTATELRDYLRTQWDVTNITDFIADRPIIITVDDSESDDSSGVAAQGIITIGEVRRRSQQPGYFWKTVIYEADITVTFEAQADKDHITETLTEIERIIDLNSLTNFDRTELLPATDNNNKSAPVIDLGVVLYDRLQAVTRA